MCMKYLLATLQKWFTIPLENGSRPPYAYDPFGGRHPMLETTVLVLRNTCFAVRSNISLPDVSTNKQTCRSLPTTLTACKFKLLFMRRQKQDENLGSFVKPIVTLQTSNISVTKWQKKILGEKMFDLRRITLFCLEKRLWKHKMTTFSKNLGGALPLWPSLATPMWQTIIHCSHSQAFWFNH